MFTFLSFSLSFSFFGILSQYVSLLFIIRATKLVMDSTESKNQPNINFYCHDIIIWRKEKD